MAPTGNVNMGSILRPSVRILNPLPARSDSQNNQNPWMQYLMAPVAAHRPAAQEVAITADQIIEKTTGQKVGADMKQTKAETLVLSNAMQSKAQPAPHEGIPDAILIMLGIGASLVVIIGKIMEIVETNKTIRRIEGCIAELDRVIERHPK
jgi:hypothetical protein